MPRTINTTTSSSTIFTIAPADTVYKGRVDLQLNNISPAQSINAALASLATLRGNIRTQLQVEILNGTVILEKPIILPFNCSLIGENVSFLVSDSFVGDYLLFIPPNGETSLRGLNFTGHLQTQIGLSNNGIANVDNCSFSDCSVGVLNDGLKLTVRDSRFADNLTGIFDTQGNATVTHNDFIDNVVGISMEARFSFITENRFLGEMTNSVVEEMSASRNIIEKNLVFVQASLADLEFTGVTLIPEIDASEHFYTGEIDTDETEITVTPGFSEHTFKIFQEDVLLEDYEVTLLPGENEFIIHIDDQIAYYTTITYVPTLLALEFTDVVIDPVFASGTRIYTGTTEAETTTITATPTDGTLAVEVYIGDVLHTEGAIPLVVGDNIITVKIADQPAYTITITRTESEE